jgi:Glucose-regulated metallo-peptidase M90
MTQPNELVWSEETYDAARGTTPQLRGATVIIGPKQWSREQSLRVPGMPPVPVAALAEWILHYATLVGGSNPAQLPALLFDATGDPWPLVHFFPLARPLSDAQRADFFAQVAVLTAHPHLDLRLIGERRHDLTAQLPPSARWLVAGHIVEVLGERSDIMDAFLARPRHIRLYSVPAAFADDGGVAGGDYDPGHERIQLGLSRLFEGFGNTMPGVAPFVHELGHMLDAFDPSSGGMGPGHGLLPGLNRADGRLFDAQARALFVAGKALEAERYAARARGRWDEPLPIGHPYVFQNDGEFIAGYLELFFRTPHRFAQLNPDLYASFAQLLRRDPRPAWPADFSFYVTENEAPYARGRSVNPAGITIPRD